MAVDTASIPKGKTGRSRTSACCFRVTSTEPILDADTVVAVDGVITAVGKQKDVDTSRARYADRCKGRDAMSGADRQPRASGIRRLDAAPEPARLDRLHAQRRRDHDDFCRRGASAGPAEGHRGTEGAGDHRSARVPQLSPWWRQGAGGCPRDRDRAWWKSDFTELAEAGVTLLGEVGLGSVKAGAEAKQMVAWARKHGIQSTIHTGGPSIPGSGLIDKDVVLEADADVIGHINGGHTSLPEAHVCELCERSTRAIEIVHNGNERTAIAAVHTARDRKCLHRVILGTDGPAGSGVQPLGILRVISLLSSLGGIPAEQAFCFATGNTARIRGLDCGLIQTGEGGRLRFPRSGSAYRRQGAAGEHCPGRYPRCGDGGDRRYRALPAQPQHAAGHGDSGRHTGNVPENVTSDASRASDIGGLREAVLHFRSESIDVAGGLPKRRFELDNP